MKKLLAFLLVLMLAAGCAGCAKQAETGAAAPEQAAGVPAQTAADASEQEPVPESVPEDVPAVVRLEGPGYATPEEAVMAYLDAMNRGDAYGMISTFAMESFAAHVDPMLYIDHNARFSPHPFLAINSIPYRDDYVVSLIAQARYGSIAWDLNACYAMYALGTDQAYNHYETAEERRALAEQFSNSVLNNIAGNVEFVEWLNPAALTGGFVTTPGAGGDLIGSMAYAGADDITEISALIRINGKAAIQGMYCVKYGDRWYNLSFGSRIIKMSVKATAANQMILWILSDEDEAELTDPALSAEYAEDGARWDALQQSDWAGTRWPMVSLSLPGVTVHETEADAENDTGAGIWAEMHFTRAGGAMITITASPALRQMLGMNRSSARIRFSWFADEIPVTRISPNNGKEIPLFRLFGRTDSIQLSLTGLSVAREESRVTFTLADGTTAVFEKPAVSAPAQAENVVPADRLEGSGYDTPEDAVLAYVDAMNRGDVRGMLSTFAIETYAAHTDPMVPVEQLGGYYISTNIHIPYADDFGRSLIAVARYGTLTGSLVSGYIMYAGDFSGNVQLKTDEDIRALQDGFARSPLAGMTGNVSFVRWINPVVLGGTMAKPGNRASEMSIMALSGADDIAEPIAELLINGKTAYLGLRCAKYNGRWYNLELSNIVLLGMNVDPQKAGLIVSSPEETADLTVSLGRLDPDAVALWNAITQSDLGGTRWTMVSLNVPGVTVYDAADAAQNDSGAGVRAELRFTGIGGGILTVEGSPALRQMLGMEDDHVRVFFAWDPESSDGSGSPVLSNLRMLPVNGSGLNLEGVAVTRNDATLTLTLPDGTQAVFGKQ